MAGESILGQLSDLVATRKAAPPAERSYVVSLLAGGVPKISAKVLEEAAEVVEAAGEPGEPGREHLVREVADLVFHALVLLGHRDTPWSAVEAELGRRFGISGIVEKESRRGVTLTARPTRPAQAAKMGPFASTTPRMPIRLNDAAHANCALIYRGGANVFYEFNIFKAAEAGDAIAIIGAIESGWNIDAVNSTNTTPLMRACRYSQTEVIRVLLAHGASLTVENHLGYRALTYAVIGSRDWAGYWGDSRPDPRPLRMLLHAGARYELREAVMLNDIELARTRLDEGADPNTGEYMYDGPLVKIAAELGYLDIVRLLLQRGASIDARDDAGQRALIGAARYGRTEVVRLLLDEGADINEAPGDGYAPLGEAALYGHSDTVALLLSRGAQRTLYDAVALNDLALAHQLLLQGHDPDGGPAIYRRLLTHAAGQGNAIGFNDTIYGRLLTYAAGEGKTAVVRLLLEHGAEHHLKWCDERPPLAEAAKRGHLDVVRLLLERGADPLELGKDGSSASALAKREGHEEIANLTL